MRNTRILFIVLWILGLLCILSGLIFSNSSLSASIVLGIVLILIPFAVGIGKYTEEK